jgi:membrane-associated phospholipid phosphatase
VVPAAFILGIVLVAITLAVLRGRSLPVWPAFLVGLVAHSLLWDRVDDLGATVHYEYVAVVDRWLGFGRLPTAVLQDWWLGDAAGIHDWFLLAVYYSFFGLPLLLVTLIRKQDAFAARRYVGALLLGSLVSLPVMALIPTAPPWLAATEGVIEPVLALKPAHMGDAAFTASVTARTNVVAAMPSLHQATAVICALAVAHTWRRLRSLAWLYAAVMGIALVYLGEHYAVDVVLGTAVAVGSWRAAAWTMNSNEAVARNTPPNVPTRLRSLSAR